MPDKPFEVKLNSVSVVILARVHNPAIINEDFLKSRSIVEQEWEVRSPSPNDDEPVRITTPGFSVVSFTNGIQLDVNPRACSFIEKVEGGFKDSYLIHDCAKRYVPNSLSYSLSGNRNKLATFP